MQAINEIEKKKCRSAWLFEVLSDNLKPQHNKTMLSLKYCKLARVWNENVENGWAILDSKPMRVVVTKKETEGSKSNS